MSGSPSMLVPAGLWDPSAPLLSPVVCGAFVLGALGCCVLAARAWRRDTRWLRQRRPGPLDFVPIRAKTKRVHLGLRALTVVVWLVLAMFAAANTYIGYVPTVSALGADLHITSEKSSIITLHLDAPGLHITDRAVKVYLPPGYETGRGRYPVMYLIHGNPGDENSWIRSGQAGPTMDELVGQGRVAPMILVAPMTSSSFVHDSECLDAVGGAQEETFLTKVVVPTIDRDFRTIATRADRAIGGMSSGAFCALNVGLRNLDEFSVIMAEQPYGDPGKPLQKSLLGGSAAAYEANSPSAYLPTMTFSHPVAVYLDAPDDDETAPIARSLAAQLQARGQVVWLRELSHERHTWTEVQAEFPTALVWVAQHLAHGTPAR
jgi:enterochelin esterase-like enzyme